MAWAFFFFFFRLSYVKKNKRETALLAKLFPTNFQSILDDGNAANNVT